jgi:hypothetical protein
MKLTEQKAILSNPDHPVDELAQRIINEIPHTTLSAAYRETAKRLYDTLNPIASESQEQKHD